MFFTKLAFLSNIFAIAAGCAVSPNDASNQSLSSSRSSGSLLNSVVTFSGSSGNSQWGRYKGKYGKRYNNQEEDTDRQRIFNKTIQDVNLHNSRSNRTYNVSLNKFADKTSRELRKIVPKLADPKQWPSSYNSSRCKGHNTAIFPASCAIDWRVCGVLTPVRDQKSCSSCWSFSATVVLESRYYIRYNKTKPLPVLSVEALLDCAGADYYNAGCDGGNAVNGYAWIYQNGGDNLEVDYPFTAGTDGSVSTCKFIRSLAVAPLTTIPGTQIAWELIQATSSTTLEQEIIKSLANGPVNVVFYAWIPNDGSVGPFFLYSGGVFTNSTGCTGVGFNHQMAIVGYGTDSATKLNYWIVRNSWSDGWGISGYAHVQRNVNLCSIESFVTYPLVN